MLALGRYKARVCACGFHESLTHDTANFFTWDVDTCPVCRGAALMSRKMDAEDERHLKRMQGPKGEDPPPEALRLSDGRHIRTRLMHPDEVEQLRQRRREGGG